MQKAQGKAAKFSITLKKVEVMVLPELTDEFVAKIRTDHQNYRRFAQ